MKRTHPFLVALLLAGSFLQAAEPMTLPQVLDQAFAQQYGIRIVKNQMQVIENGRILATAGMLPKVDLTGGYTYSHKDAEQIPVSVTSPNGVTITGTWNGQLGLSWVLFDGFKMFRAYEQVHGTADLNLASARVQLENQAVQIITAYWNLVAQRQVQRRAVAQVELSQARLRQLESRKELGVSTGRELLQSQVDANADSSLLLDANLQADLALGQLNLLLGGSAQEPLDVVDEVPLVSDPPSLDVILQQAIAQNRELMVSQQKIRTTGYNLGIYQANYWPSLTFNASYGYTGVNSELPTATEIENTAWSGQVGINLKWNLFNGLQDRTNIQNAAMEQQNARLEEHNKRLQLENSLRIAYTKVKQSLSRHHFEMQSLELAERNHKSVEESQKAGLQSALELRTAQQQLLAAQIRELQSRLNAQLADLEMQRLLGVLPIE